MYKDRVQVHDCIFHLLALETINYILSKKIDQKQKTLVKNL